MALLKVVVLDGRALNRGDLNGEALRVLGELQPSELLLDSPEIGNVFRAATYVLEHGN